MARDRGYVREAAPPVGLATLLAARRAPTLVAASGAPTLVAVPGRPALVAVPGAGELRACREGIRSGFGPHNVHHARRIGGVVDVSPLWRAKRQPPLAAVGVWWTLCGLGVCKTSTTGAAVAGWWTKCTHAVHNVNHRRQKRNVVDVMHTRSAPSSLQARS